MIRAALVALTLTFAAPAAAQTPAETARAAAISFDAAIGALDEAATARDRISALTRTIGAYEIGLAGLRDALRQVQLAETRLSRDLDAREGRIAQLLGVLAQIEAQPGPLLLLHPAGPLGTVRSGMILSDVTPALQAETETLRDDLAALRDLRAVQASAAASLSRGLDRVQAARVALSQAMSDRTALPVRLTDAPAALAALRDSAETLAAFADSLAGSGGGTAEAAADFAALRGRLPSPVRGTLLRAAGEADARGVRRPGVALSTRPRAIVTAPTAATIRYLGPLLDYGNVMILEPGGGYLFILAGMGTLFGQTGEIVAAGAPLGLMGGADGTSPLTGEPDSAGARATETLYIEMRRGTEPEDPAPWFAALGEQVRE
ncbi:MAG TPA: peptidoglycan DD-metalloendopeptidase family protein [Paracoccaceae bacterium]|nr:peptidoglycan DD-metalloendopeptidase family protein [Paracoccaceae bacterium]